MSSIDDDFPNIGARLRKIRRARRLKLLDVADAVGCSEGYLSKIENSKTSPSLSVLHRIASALDTNMSYLFDTNDDRNQIVARSGERPIVELDPLRQGNGIQLERVIPYSEDHMLQCNIHIIESGGASEGQIEHDGEELGYILDGELELTVENDTYVLSAGDSFHFDSRRPHGYRNATSQVARVFWVNTPPTF